MQQERFKVRPYIEAALLVSMAFVLSAFTLFQMPLGGAVTPGSTIPVCIVSLRHGVRVGMLAGLVFGVLKFLSSSVILGVGPFVLDYLLAFTSLGLCFFFYKMLISQSRIVLNLVYGSYVLCASVCGQILVPSDTFAVMRGWFPYMAVTASQMVRLSLNILSGVLFFSDGMGFQSALILSVSYNASFLIPDVLIGLFMFHGLIKKSPLLKKQGF
jgi:thiamine transporter